MIESRKQKGRLAPSPTGGLHLGNARSFLVSWLLIRQSGGRLVFRMEDLDASRARDEAAKAAMTDLRSLGLDWDEGPDIGGPDAPYVQSQRFSIYQKALDRLIQKELVYPCTCSRTDVLRAATAPHAGDMPIQYPGTCSQRTAKDAQRLEGQGIDYAWRFRCELREVDWHDEVLGPQHHCLSHLGGDFIVARSGNTFGYQLAVVVDDAAMGITQVVRGNDLVESTPRQILIQEALGFPQPAYWHLGLVLDEHGKRLAKRDQSVKIAQLMSQGVDVTGILLESLGWNFSGRQSPWDQLQMALANGSLNTNLLVPDFLWKCDKLHKVF